MKKIFILLPVFLLFALKSCKEISPSEESTPKTMEGQLVGSWLLEAHGATDPHMNFELQLSSKSKCNMTLYITQPELPDTRSEVGSYSGTWSYSLTQESNHQITLNMEDEELVYRFTLNNDTLQFSRHNDDSNDFFCTFPFNRIK